MKKQLLTILAIGSFAAAHAQITVTQADVAGIGFFMPRGIDTSYTETPIGAGGANLMWDFSGIVDDRGDTLTFVNPATLPNAGDYPTANLGVVFSNQTLGFGVLNADSFSIIGQGASVMGQDVVIDVNPAEVIVKFPSNYGTTWNNTSIARSRAIAAAVVPGTDSARITITKIKDAEIDAWGTLITPLGTFSVLRQKENLDVTQDIELHTTGPFPPPMWIPAQSTNETSTHYFYWANGIGYPIMEVDSANGGPVDITWLITAPQIGIKEIAKNSDPRVFPNPANESMFIGLDKNTDVVVEIFDLQGKMVQQSEAKGIVAKVSVADLATGLYVYKVTAVDGSFVHQGKFNVSR